MTSGNLEGPSFLADLEVIYARDMCDTWCSKHEAQNQYFGLVKYTPGSYKS